MFQAALSLSPSKVGCLVFLRPGTKGFGIAVPPPWRTQHVCPSQAGSAGCGSGAAAPGVAHGGAVPPLHGCSVCGKGFQETIDQMKPL